MSAQIFYYDIGDYLSREQKLKIISDFKSMANLPFVNITPNEHGDWISQRNDKFSTWIPIESDEKLNQLNQSCFIAYSNGIVSSRDQWVYNSSTNVLIENVTKTINFYNSQVSDFLKAKEMKSELSADEFKNNDSTKISWSSSLVPKLQAGKKCTIEEKEVYTSIYRPFFKQHYYFGEMFTHRRALWDIFIPNKNIKNKFITLTGKSARGFSVLMTDTFADMGVNNFMNGGTQCFPLYWYEEIKADQGSLFDSADGTKYIKHEAISDFILDRARTKYGNKVSKEDIFYYVYGILHSKSYRETFSADLKKMLPRLPLVSDYQKFFAFADAGRKLAELHLNYEDIAPCSDVVVTGADKNDFVVTQMKFVKKGEKHTIIYNDKITLSNIPQKAYDYVVNGKSAIEWIMERYAITTDKKSGIVNNPNDWAKEHEKPRYILDLLLSMINVSVQTVDIVNALPEVDWDKE